MRWRSVSRTSSSGGSVPSLPQIPVLQTERLVLRPHRADDLDAYAGMWADENVVRFIGGVPLTREQSWARILQYRGMWTLLGFGFWAIEDRATGRLVGEAGLHDMQRDITPTLAGTLECGWLLLPSAQGRGLAEEAVRTVLDWAAQAHPGIDVTCIIDPGNAASLRLAGRLGFGDPVSATYRERDLVLLRIAAGRH